MLVVLSSFPIGEWSPLRLVLPTVYPTLSTSRIQSHCRNFCSMCKRFCRRKIMSFEWRVRHVRKKRIVSVKENIRVGKWVLKKWKCHSERSYGKGKKRKGKLILVIYCHCSCFIPHFPLKMFSSKREYCLIQEYVRHFGSNLSFCSKSFRITHYLIQNTINWSVVLVLIHVFQSSVFSWLMPWI